MTKRALLVARVSTDPQAKFGYSLPTQLEAMRKYTLSYAMEIAGEVTNDCSGSIPIYDRPGGKQIYRAIKARAVDALVFYTIDRASRDEDVLDFIILKRDLREAEIELHFCDTGKSEHDSVTGIIEYIRVSEAGRERKKIIERTQRGKHAKAEAGKWVGNTHPPYGYRRVGEKREARLEIDKQEAVIVRRVFEMFLGADGQPMGMMGIAAALTAEGVPPPSAAHKAKGDTGKDAGKRGKRNGANGWYGQAVKTMLKRRDYIGEFESYSHPVYLPELAIIDQTTFAEAQKRFEHSRALAGMYARKYDYLLGGRIRCACGHSMLSHGVKKGRFLYYVCYYAFKERHLRKCTERYLRANLADPVVWDWLEGLLRDEAQLDEGLTKYGEKRESELQPQRERLAALNAEIVEAECKIKELSAEFAQEKDKFVAATLREQQKLVARSRVAALGARASVLNELTRKELSEQDKASIRQWAADVRAELEELTFEKKRALLAMLDLQAKIEYQNGARGLFVTCGLKLDGDYLSLEKEGLLTNNNRLNPWRCTQRTMSSITARKVCVRRLMVPGYWAK